MIDVSGKGLPPELGVVDVDFVSAEALSQARIDLLDLLEKRAKQVSPKILRTCPLNCKPLKARFSGVG